MRRHLWLKILALLLAVILLAMTAAWLFRSLVVADFARYRQGETVDRIYWVTASLESSYERHGGWQREGMVEGLAWALRLGVEARLNDPQGRLLMDSGQALAALSPLARKRLGNVQATMTREGPFEAYPLFLGGEEIGLLEVRTTAGSREALFVSRANRFLLWSSLALGGFAVGLSIFMARRLTAPLHRLAAASEAIGRGELAARVPVRGEDELALLSRSFNRMAETLELQESLRKRLYANAAHELRTPLAAMRGELEALQDGLIPATPQQFASLLDETRRLTALVEGVESLVQAENTLLDLKREPLDSAGFVTGLTGRYAPLFAGKGVGLATALPDGLIVWADPDRLSQVLVNLLTNALRATAAGGAVTVGGHAVAGGTELWVADTGHGIDDHDIPLLFERFFHGPGGGHGIGLAIVQEIMAGHGGRVAVESRPGEGSRFTLFFPEGS
jgi:two-component system sensor histidine kinase BaeS